MQAHSGFDCVALKNRIQAEMLEERSRLGEDEQMKLQREWLQTADDALARWWRELSRQAMKSTSSSVD